jgi:hypothetical protein
MIKDVIMREMGAKKEGVASGPAAFVWWGLFSERDIETTYNGLVVVGTLLGRHTGEIWRIILGGHGWMIWVRD